MKSSSVVLACPLCSTHFSHAVKNDASHAQVFGYGLDYRVVPRETNISSDLAVCPNCFFASLPDDFHGRIPGHLIDLARSRKYISIFEDRADGELRAGAWLAFAMLNEAKGLNPRELAVLTLKGSWVARELYDVAVEEQLLDRTHRHLDDAL
ncbi:MAG: DUF2225 domain-containing protein, partial [Pseudomonadota bacterium]